MMSGIGRNSFLFTPTQWQELEHQALIFKYMAAGMPIPSDLLFTIKRSLDASLSSNLILHQPQQIGWNCYQMGFGRKIDPEPGRCRRTDGKKWRCSKEAYPDSKYCERHMHRGRNRSRKPVDTTTTTTTTMTSTTNYSSSSTPPSSIIIPISSSSSSSITKNPNPSSSYSLSSNAHLSHHNQPSWTNTHHVHHPFLNPHSSTSPQEKTTHLLLSDPSPYSHQHKKDYRRNRYGHGVKEEVDEHDFFSQTNQTMRSSSASSIDDSWQLTMGSSKTHLEQRTCSGIESTGYSYLQLTDTSKHQNQYQHCFAFGGTDATLKIERGEEPRKVMHHFFDESPPRNNKDSSWLGSEDRSWNHKPVSETQLSISIPNYSPHFSTTHNRN